MTLAPEWLQFLEQEASQYASPPLIASSQAPVEANYNAVGGTAGAQAYIQAALAPEQFYPTYNYTPPEQGYSGLQTGQQVGPAPLTPYAEMNALGQYGESTDDFGYAGDPIPVLNQMYSDMGYPVDPGGSVDPNSPADVMNVQRTQTISDIFRNLDAGNIPQIEADRSIANLRGEIQSATQGSEILGAIGGLPNAIKNFEIPTVGTVANSLGLNVGTPRRESITLGQMYDVTDIGPEVGDATKAVLGDNIVSRSIGAGADLAFAPENLVGGALLKGTGIGANLLGRGSQSLPAFAGTLGAFGAADNVLKEVNAPAPLRIAGSLAAASVAPGALKGIETGGLLAGREALARTAASQTANRILPTNLIPEARFTAQRAGKLGMDPTAAARSAIGGNPQSVSGAGLTPEQEAKKEVQKANGWLNAAKGNKNGATYLRDLANNGGLPIPPNLKTKAQMVDFVTAYKGAAEKVVQTGQVPGIEGVTPASVQPSPVSGSRAPSAGSAPIEAATPPSAGIPVPETGSVPSGASAPLPRASGLTAAPEGFDRAAFQQQRLEEAQKLATTPTPQSAGGSIPPPQDPPTGSGSSFDPEQWKRDKDKWKAESDPFTDIQPKSTARVVAENLAAIPSAWKSTQAGGDILGGTVRNNLPMWFAETRAAGRGTKEGWKAYFTDPDTYDILKEMDDIPLFRGGQVTTKSGKLIDIEPMANVMNLNSWETPGYELLNDSAVARWSRKFPLLKRGDNALRANMVAAASVARARWVKQAIDAGIEDPALFKFYDGLAKSMVGAGDVWKWARGISNNFYSLQLLASRLQTFQKPFVTPGQVFRNPVNMVKDKSVFSASPRGVASRNLVRFIAGESANLLMLSAAGQMSGMFNVGYDPLGTGFGRLEFDDDEGNTYSTDLLGGYGALIKMAVRVSDGLINPESEYDPLGEFATFFRNKTAPASSLVIDTLLENLPGTKDNEMYKSPFAINLLSKDMISRDGLASLIEKSTPFWAGESLSSLARGTKDIRDPADLLESAALMMTQLAGGPTSLFAATPSESLESAANKLNPPIPWAEMGQAERAEFINANESLRPLYDKQQDAREGRSSEITDKKYEALSDISALAKTDPQEYRRLAGDAVREAAIRFDEAKINGEIGNFPVTSDIGKAVDGYYKALEPARTGVAPDYDMQEKLGADYLASLPEDMRERVLKELAYSKDETYAQLLRDRMELAEYFNLRDKEWQETAAKNQRFAGTTSSDQWVQEEIERLTAKGQAPATARIIAEAIVSAYTAQSSIGSKVYLVKNRDKIALLNKWGYSIAESLAALDPEYLKQYQGTR